MTNEEINTEETSNESKKLYCPYCKGRLMLLEPDGITFYCQKCDKYFKNNNGIVGEETVSPYTDKDVIY